MRTVVLNPRQRVRMVRLSLVEREIARKWPLFVAPGDRRSNSAFLLVTRTPKRNPRQNLKPASNTVRGFKKFDSRMGRSLTLIVLSPPVRSPLAQAMNTRSEKTTHSQTQLNTDGAQDQGEDKRFREAFAGS